MPYPYYGFNPYQMQVQSPQQSSFVHVQNERQAREWAVALGSSVTFIDDTAPYCYTKSMGVSQFEAPVFKKFRLVEETEENAQEQPSPSQSIDISEYITKAEFEPFKSQIEVLQNQIKELTANEPVE